jgi:hypothetical protein
MNLVDRLKRDMRASAPKTAALAILTGVGLYFWIPPLWRAAAGDKEVASSSTPPEPAPSAASATSPEPPPLEAKGLTWEEAERLRAEDELFLSVGREAVRPDAFRFGNAFLPLDVEFGDDVPGPAGFVISGTSTDQPEAPGETASSETNASEPTPAEPPPLKLASTLVSAGKRAAVINDRVYVEGATIAVAGRTWTLKNVEPRRVVLDGETGPLELRINPFAGRQPLQ